jgi:hypothetical protein
MQQLPAGFLTALEDREEVLVTSREGSARGTVPMWFMVAPPGVVYLFTFAFSEKARRWRTDPWVRLTVPGDERQSVEGTIHFVPPDSIDDELGSAIVERWGIQGAPTINGLRRTIRDGVHALVRVEARQP